MMYILVMELLLLGEYDIEQCSFALHCLKSRAASCTNSKEVPVSDKKGDLFFFPFGPMVSNNYRHLQSLQQHKFLL